MHAKERSVIKPFSFASFDAGEEVKSFNFHDLNGGSVIAHKKVDDKALRIERKLEKENQFHIYDMVREHRGITDQETADYEKRVAEEVEKVLAQVKDKAYSEGLEAGKLEGHDEAKKAAAQVFSKQIEEMRSMIESLQLCRVEQLEQNKAEIYKMIKSMVKWVSLKEMSELSYLPKLLEKMILELNERHNLLIKISEESAERMPEVISSLESRLGQLPNLRVEISSDLNGSGLILESEKGILDASLDVLFKSIDKLFETVGVEIDHPGVE